MKGIDPVQENIRNLDGSESDDSNHRPKTFREKYFPTVDEKKKRRDRRLRMEHSLAREKYLLGNSQGITEEFGEDPIVTFCPYCQVSVTTRTTLSANVVCYFLFGMCSLCVPGCHEVKHKCPLCRAVLGNYAGIEIVNK